MDGGQPWPASQRSCLVVRLGYPRSTVGGDALSGAQACLEAICADARRASTVVVVAANPTQGSLPLGTSDTGCYPENLMWPDA
jgi:hypothetical protein